ncbi:MAG: SLBB domain-containing protein [Deltaproteobacteria bacterium]|nr:SLBB domain-containing protein [Deltaproteobacteria bacterium]
MCWCNGYNRKGMLPGWGIFIFVFGVMLLMGCGGKTPTTEDISKIRMAQQERDSRTAKLNQRIFAKAAPIEAVTDPLLGPGDLIEVKVFEAPDLETEARISARGFITLPLLGDVKVAGLSARQVEMKIEELYKGKYIRDPHVSLFVKEQLAQKITLVGEVRTPGSYEMPGRMRLLDALTLAGGLTEKAGSTAQVRRLGKTKNDAGSYVVDLDQLINKGKAELNIQIHGGDIIFVPESGMFYVDGAVRRSGSFPLKPGLTVEQAIMTAGGLLSYADAEDIMLVRRDAEGKRVAVLVNLEKAEDSALEMNDGDILVVGSTFWGRVASGGGFSLGFPGIFSLGFSNPERYR